ncbi:MAG: hypothetical protein JW867_03040 [Candidatus Omnitrophica bacterium]|nr:hypothetical protein [Candidatus Omnitrophota bacterium]
MFLKNQKCKDCAGRQACQNEIKSWVFVVIGLMATVSIRVVTVLMSFSEFYGKVAWYIGVLGFILFFWYKYKVFKQRADYIEKNNLIRKISGGESLTAEEKTGITNILCTIRSNKERINFYFIFVASFIALLLAVYIDFIK